MISFETAVSFVLDHEGGYVNDPDDAGGETNFGISRRAYPELDIRGLTRAAASEIYRRDYWERTRCQDLPGAVAMVVLDTGVNMGVRVAGAFLQMAVNAQAATTRRALLVDGIIGRQTVDTVNFIAGCGRLPVHLANDMLLRRIARYEQLARKESNRKFLSGWIRRATELAGAIA